MIGRCVGAARGGEYIFQFDGAAPQLGFLYELENITEHSKAQRAAFHALLNAYWGWMVKIDTFHFEDNGRIFDFRVPSAEKFREYFKYQYGPHWFEYVDDDFQTQKAKTLDDIPTHILTWDKDGKRRYKLVLKSMADYTKKQYQAVLQALIDVIHFTSCHDWKVNVSLLMMDHGEYSLYDGADVVKKGTLIEISKYLKISKRDICEDLVSGRPIAGRFRVIKAA
jgi:hypothetical protein